MYVLLFAALLGSGAAGGAIGFGSWDEALLFVNRAATGVADPILGLDTGFYLFALPLVDRLFVLLALASTM